MSAWKKMVWEAYRPALEETFKHHPNKEEALNELRFSNDVHRIDELFAEADAAYVEAFHKRFESIAASDGVITFTIRKGNRD